MASKGQGAKSRLITKVAAQAKSAAKKKADAPSAEFVQWFFENVPPDDILDRAPAELAGWASQIWSFAQQRQGRKPKIRAYNPKLEEHGYSCGHTVVEMINDDMPFLVDSVTQEMNRRGVEVHLVIHPILSSERDGKGKLKGFGPRDTHHGDGKGESFIHLQVSEQPESRLPEIEKGLLAVLEDVRAAVTDWLPMRQRCRDLMRELQLDPPNLPAGEVQEALTFLEWLDNDHFTYLGYREYSFTGSGKKAVAKIDKSSGLGLLADPSFSVFDGLRNLGQLPPDVQDFVKTPELLRVTKANKRSTVHRTAHLDTVAIKCFDHKGTVTGERLFVGLFTSVAYNRSPRDIPLLRLKVANILARAGFVSGSHDGKALTHILETYPRDELFQASEEELYKIGTGILHLQERQRTALFVRRDPFERFVSCMVYVPRDRYDTNLRLKLQAILAEAYKGEVTSFSTFLGDQALARLHLTIKTKVGDIPEVDEQAVEARLAATARSWSDGLRDELVAQRGEEVGLLTCERFGKAFPTNYQEVHVAKDAVADLLNIEATIETGDIAMDLYRPIPAREHELRFKVYICGRPIPLSDVLPMLERMGLKVIGEVPYEIQPGGEGDPVVWIHDFDMELQGAGDLDLEAIRESFHDVFHKVWQGRLENDGFNKLVLAAGLTSREILILRAYCKYLRQAQIPFSQSYMEETLARNPELARLLSQFFMTKFDPATQGRGLAAKLNGYRGKIAALLEDVSNLDEDRIIRRYLNLIESTLRTNYWQLTEAGAHKDYVSFKLASREIEELPRPRPFREIFVYSPKIEGVHLRFGMVARGGLRWSDRMEDFRTEILGLVKAQQVKNAVIVPVGSKGGFVGKRLPDPAADRQAWLAEGIECYKTFIRGLLDITDNLKAGKLVPPGNVARHDGDDPYLVVAADKGTATFSDIANGVSADYGFWLDDAFASGGSAGYDHKAMGITARGAWESVKRHFREIGKDIQKEDFTCIGVGDMGGDVFGNGMLLSKHIRLQAAFNHLHIFIDPSPDAAESWKERKRLFDAVKGWGDYDAKLISKGGGVFDRRAKSIKLTPEIKELTGCDKESCTPNELINLLLKAEVELLWFGGIGTYVKHSQESHGDVGDRANDAIRVSAPDVGARVLGEGANLGVTQRARIEYALRGGRCNTDAIDNSAGVDCSDHEVNIKILLGALEQSKKMTRKQRDKLLEQMTDEVSSLVLRDNYLQTLSISVTEHLGVHLLDRLARFMRTLEKSGQLDRALEFLPDDDTIAERAKQGQGLTRPEISVLLSYAKLVLYDELLSSKLPDDKFLADHLVTYFPTPLRRKYGAQIGNHRLRREIVATVVTNEVINRLGIAFVHEVKEKTGMPAEEICRAYLAACEIFGLYDLWRQIEALDNKVPAGAQADMVVECGRLCEQATVWLLRNAEHPLRIEAEIKNYAHGVKTLSGRMSKLLTGADAQYFEGKTEGFAAKGVPASLARDIALLRYLGPTLDVVRIANMTKLPVTAVGHTYFDIGHRFGFDWLRYAARQLPSDNAWDKLAISAILDDLFGYQREVAISVLYDAKAKQIVSGKSDRPDSEKVLGAWAEKRKPLVTRTDQLLSELQASGTPDLAMLAVANRQLKSMVE